MRRLLPCLLLCIAACSSAPDEGTTAEEAALSPVQMKVDRTNVLAPRFEGFGAQLNQNVYAAISAPSGVTAGNLGAMEQKVETLAPRHVRIFWDQFAKPDEQASFLRTVDLARRAGATVNVTCWHGPYPNPTKQMASFADALQQVLALVPEVWVTIQNEVNSTAITKENYAATYVALDGALRAKALRSKVHFVGGDLLLGAGDNAQGEWLQDFATRPVAGVPGASTVSDMFEGYSFHVYWDYFSPAKLRSRLAGIKAAVDALPARARKPMYLSEFGVRGDYDPGTLPAPGRFLASKPAVDATGIEWGGTNGQAMSKTPIEAFQSGVFAIESAKLGFVSALRWDAYDAIYNEDYKGDWGMIGWAKDGWPTRPSYSVMRALHGVAEPGWKIVGVSGDVDGRIEACAFAGPNGQVGFAAFNDTKYGRTVEVGGLGANATLRQTTWSPKNPDDASPANVRTDAKGVAKVWVPSHGVVAVRR
jgi:hypothetical protein